MSQPDAQLTGDSTASAGSVCYFIRVSIYSVTVKWASSALIIHRPSVCSALNWSIGLLIRSLSCQIPTFVRVLCVYWHWRSRLHLSGTHSTCSRPLSPCAGPARQRRQPAPFQSWLSQSASVFVWLRWAGHVTVVRPLLASSSKATHTPDNLSVGNDEHRDVTPTATPSSFLAFLGTPDQSSLTRPSAITRPPQRADYVTAVGRVCLAGWASPLQRIRALSDELHVLRFVSGLQQLGCSA